MLGFAGECLCVHRSRAYRLDSGQARELGCGDYGEEKGIPQG
jgi:hypothetical protein